MKAKYTISQIKPGICHIQFDNYYDLCMHFVRYQEFYESPNPKFRGKSFEIIDFMEWYTKNSGKEFFSYTIDWAGFNIPGETILKVQDDVGISDWNKYDETMLDIYHKCSKLINNNHRDCYEGPKFYMIGTVGKTALKHEIAHGFFYLIPEYKKEMTKLVDALKPKFRNTMYKGLKKMGYTEKVFKDECQAYLSTGMFESLGTLQDEDKPFIKLYYSYYINKIKVISSHP